MKIPISKLSAFVLIFSLFSTFALADDNDNDDTQTGSFACADASNVMDCIEKTKQVTPAPVTELPSINTQQLGLAGPVSLGVRYDNVLGWIPELTYSQIFYDNGLFLQLNYGANEQRANITLGHQFNPHQQIKLTYEYLAQNLPFDFASGSVNEWVNQNAFGAAYRYLFTNQILRSIELNGYYIHANNKDLSEVIYYQNNDAYLNLRHIAGGAEETVTTSITLSPLRQVLLSLGGGYSHLVYDTTYEDNQNTTTLAYNAGLDFLISSRTKLSAGIVNSAAETDSSIKFSQILPAHIEAAVTGQYSQGQAGQPNSSSVTLAFAYPVISYTMAANDSLGALKTWVQKPVVHATRVLAIKDEKVIKFAINAVNPPAQTLLTGQAIQPLATQSIFSFDPELFDRVDYSLSLLANNNNLTNPQSQLNITVQPLANDKYNATIYSIAPIPNSATPNGAPIAYHVIITALGYKTGLVAPIQAQADLVLNLNFNHNNEPQWNKTDGAINFDANDTTDKNNPPINLNTFITKNGNQSVKFYFDDPKKYTDWDITTSGYLVRKPDANGAFDAGDISTTPKDISISAQYTDDPDGTVVPSTTLKITVNADTGIVMQWNASLAACQFDHNLDISQPYPSDPVVKTFTLFGANPCILYWKNNNPISVVNDKIGAMSTSSTYTSGISINGNTLNVNYPMPADLASSSWPVTIIVPSTATGPTPQNVALTGGIPVSNQLTVAGKPENTATLTGMFKYAAIYVRDLDDAKRYTLAGQSISNLDNNFPTPFVCPGEISDPDSASCPPYSSSSGITSKDGSATLLWAYYPSNANPTTINSVTLTLK